MAFCTANISSLRGCTNYRADGLQQFAVDVFTDKNDDYYNCKNAFGTDSNKFTLNDFSIESG